MQDDDFEWDDEKAAANVDKHGVAFDAARAVFNDPFAIELDDDGAADETRYRIVGKSGDRLLFVAYTYRLRRIRITSARGAEPYERRMYHEENS
jgi:uncharacterized DUF497 family protein